MKNAQSISSRKSYADSGKKSANELLALIESEGFSPTELVSTTPAKKVGKTQS
ncbi:hypothetical protein LNO19_26435 [Klebsiella quasipneumoniae subsp. similipneumoniae]|nr:hypothetical protein [Klebsiella quasipneumoniae subsp. similipneumoniae]